jgi:hypothetical protein
MATFFTAPFLLPDQRLATEWLQRPELMSLCAPFSDIKKPAKRKRHAGFELVGRDRFELSTNRLKVYCSTD